MDSAKPLVNGPLVVNGPLEIEVEGVKIVATWVFPADKPLTQETAAYRMAQLQRLVQDNLDARGMGKRR
jgi:hypothetical protein